MHDGTVRILQKVRWVPDLRRNLLSESMFDDLGCHIHTHNGVRTVMKNGKTLIKGVKRNGLYHVVGNPVLSAYTVSSEINACMNLKQTQLWHNRLGHIGNKGLHYLFKTGCLKLKDRKSVV